jgi:hypothetical protein
MEMAKSRSEDVSDMTLAFDLDRPVRGVMDSNWDELQIVSL